MTAWWLAGQSRWPRRDGYQYICQSSKDISFLHLFILCTRQQALFAATAGPRDVCLQFTMMPPGPSATPVTRPVRFHVQLHVELNDAKTAAAASTVSPQTASVRLPTMCRRCSAEVDQARAEGDCCG